MKLKYNPILTAFLFLFISAKINAQVIPFGMLHSGKTAGISYRDTKTEVVEVTSATGKIWMDRNLGATRAATSSIDYLAYGDLYQWGRGADGHQTIVWTSSTTSNGAEQTKETALKSSTDQPVHGDFILVPSTPYDWRSEQSDNLWQGVSGINNPCPSGYRLPTETEWEAERASWIIGNNSAGALASPLKLPMAGFRRYSSGTFNNPNGRGGYWSSGVFSTKSSSLGFNSSGAIMGNDYRADGRTVRCIKD